MSIKGLMPKRDGRDGGSRDWSIGEIPCACSECHCNNGYGKCVVPSKISLDYKGRCYEAKRLDSNG